MKKTALSIAMMATLGTFAQTVSSPDGRILVNVGVNDAGTPEYSVQFKGETVVTPSTLGLVADEKELKQGFSVTYDPVTGFDQTWKPVWGQYAEVRDNHNELVSHFTAADGTKFDVVFRVFNDGLGFRYVLPEQPSMNYLTLRKELTEFNFGQDLTMFCIPGDYDTDEFLYTTTPISNLRESLSSHKFNHTEGNSIDALSVQTPLLLKSEKEPLYINIHEAALVGYPGMALDADTQAKGFSSHLTPDKLGVAAYLQLPFATPWRTIMLTDDARDILASQLIYNLNEPSKIEDTSWIKPTKFMGVWWEMFLGNGLSWAYSDKYNAKPGITDYSALAPSGRHAANNDNVKKYIDFASKWGIPALLVEGWNQGWEDWAGYRKNRQFSFTTPYPDFDIDMLTAYAKDKGVQLIMHHETAANAADYERQLDDAFRYMVDHGYNSVKTGYVGHIIPRSEYHSSQWMVDHYIHVVDRAKDFKIMVDSHEAVRPTGLARTYPNWIAQESARGGEWESMGGNPPEHTVILPFTRLVGGPMDYTPGLFETRLSTYGTNQSQAGTTMMRQLALYLTMPSPLQMACDLPENYERFPDAFRFIIDVPVDWQDSRYLEAEPGDYITVARKDKHSEDWYVGAITDENAREANIDFSFLTPGVDYVATIYQDGKDADWKENPQSYDITERKVNSRSKLKVRLAPGGGAAIRLQPRTK